MTAGASIAHPRAIEVPIMGGERRLPVRPWVMALRAELRPKIEALVTKWVTWQAAPADFELGAVLLEFEDECAAIAELTVRADLAAMGVRWEELWVEDLALIVQAIWETSIHRPDGSGLAGKLLGVLGPALVVGLQNARTFMKSEEKTSEPSQPITAPFSGPKSPGSASSPGDGEPIPNGSAGV